MLNHFAIKQETEMESDKGIIDYNNIDQNLAESLVAQSTYLIFYHQSNNIDYSRNVKEIIKPSLLTDFGFPPKFTSIYYLTTTLSE